MSAGPIDPIQIKLQQLLDQFMKLTSAVEGGLIGTRGPRTLTPSPIVAEVKALREEVKTVGSNICQSLGAIAGQLELMNAAKQ